MRKIIFLFHLIVSFVSYSQVTDFNKVILPSGVTAPSFEEKLVQLSWSNHPSSKILIQNVQMFDKQRKESTLSWMDNITGTFNANQFTLNPASDLLDRSAYYPKYNIGVRLSLGTFALTPIQTKIAKDRVKIGEYQINEGKLALRRNVLLAIEIYKEGYKVLRIRERLKEDFLVLFKETEKKFSQGQTGIDEYQLASQAYYGRAEAVINATSSFNQSKIELEELVGVRLEDIEGYNEFLKLLESEIRL